MEQLLVTRKGTRSLAENRPEEHIGLEGGVDKTLYIVHCVDTEGPLFESLGATADRLRQTFGLNYDLTREKLQRLRQGLDLPEALRLQVMDFLSEARMGYKTTWAEVDEMVCELMSPEWRLQHADDFGQGYVFSWFILDHVGFETNPRRRALGFHQVLEHYQGLLKQYQPPQDQLYWHNHPVSYFLEANKTSNNWSYTNHHIQVLSRRVIDHLSFPAAYRPGSHTERPDINLFLELWIPIDFGNQGMPERPEDAAQRDLSAGRYGDWRRAPDSWEVYHPDFYDYQQKGGMRRYVARCLNLESRIRCISRAEIAKAFARVDSGTPTILSVTCHDEREMRPATAAFMALVREVQAEFPEVRLRHSNAVDAVRRVEGLEPRPPARFSFEWQGPRLQVWADGDLWGPQPFFCFKTRGFQYIHENLDVQGERHWSFVFDDNFVELSQLEAVGLASNDRFGNTTVCRIDVRAPEFRLDQRFLNAPCY